MSEIILTSSVLILVIALLRRVLRGRISSRVQYALWLLAALRLLIPGVLFPSPVSVVGAAEELRGAYLQGCVGRVYHVLYEQEADGLFQGHAPNYMTVAAEGKGLHNRVLPTRILGVRDGGLLGELMDK